MHAGGVMNTEWSNQGWASLWISEILFQNPSKYASQLEENLKSLSLVLVAWQPTSVSTDSQETNVQRLSTSHECFFHMEKVISRTPIFLPPFLVLGIPSGFF